MAGYSADAVEAATVEAGVTARAVQRMPGIPVLAVGVAKAVGWARVAFRVRTLLVWQHEVRRVCATMRN